MKTRLTDYEYITSFTRAYQETTQAPIALREARCLAVAARYLYLPPQKGDLLCGRLLCGHRAGGFIFRPGCPHYLRE